MRAIYMVSGFCALALAIVGIVLPLLPTTPFLLVSAFCFARSSPKFHDWLLAHPYFGTVIKEWQQYRAISKRSKISAMVVILFTMVLSVALRVPTSILIIQIIVLSLSALFILTRPDGPKKTVSDQ